METIRIANFLKTSFIDYPDHISSVAYVSGCNLKCPFCHNGDLVNHIHAQMPLKSWLEHLESKNRILDGVVVSGGEPTAKKDLIPMLALLKAKGIKVKLDTNGTYPQVINQIIKAQLVDYIAMDLKNTLSKYALTTGVVDFDHQSIIQSIELIINSGIKHEFRTTLIKEFHTPNDCLEMAGLIEGCDAFTLQQYQHSEEQLSSMVYTAYTLEEMEKIKGDVQSVLKLSRVNAIGRF